MEKVSFNDLVTSSLGFGCTRLADSKNQKFALETLDTAFNLGITHFDTARLYGFGESEHILGLFAKNKRDKITITTKIGLEPIALPTKAFFFLKLAKNIVNSLPFVKRLLIKQTNGWVNRPPLTLETVSKHLEESLKKLQTDYIDILLLHEVRISDANRLELIDFFKEKVSEGKIRYFGLGTSFDTMKLEMSRLNTNYKVVQVEHNLLRPNINQLLSIYPNSILTNGHSIFKDLKLIQEYLNTNKTLATLLKKEVGIDISIPQNLSRVLLIFAKYSNSTGINIFTSSKKETIKNNIDAWINPMFTQEQVMFIASNLCSNLNF